MRMINEVPSDMLAEFLQEDEKGVVFTIKVKPGATVEKLSINNEFELTLSIRAKAVENAANIRVKEALAEIFSVPPSRVEIVCGQKSRVKRILLRNQGLVELIKGRPHE